MRRFLAVVAFMVVVATPALAAGKGSSMLALQVGQGSGDFVDPILGAGHYIPVGRDIRSQIQVGAEYWYLLADDYAFTVAGSYGFYSEKDQAGNSPDVTDLDATYSTRGFKVRVGGDRVGKIGERFTWFMGPGLEYWSGKNKFENIYSITAPDNSVEGPSVTRFGVNGRVGGVMAISPQIGVMGRIGDTFGYASADDKGAKTKWYPSSFEAMWGLNFTFGGK